MTPNTAPFLAMTLGCLFVLLPPASAEAAGDAAMSACLAELRQEMGRFKVPSPDPKMQQELAGLCARGDIEGALRLAVPAAAAERCVHKVREVAAVEPVPSQEALSNAYQLCRRGELEAALAAVGGVPIGGEPVPGGAPSPPDPPAPTGPPNIFRFQATPSTVRAGEPSQMLWDVYSSSAVHFDGEAVPARGERVVRPTRTTRYTLTATSPVESVDDTVTVSVSPYPPATLGDSIGHIEVCRELGSEEGDYRCLSPDGPFYAGDAVQVILHFDALSAGTHELEYELFAGTLTQPQRWTRIDHAQGPFSVGEGAAPRPATGRRPKRSSVRDHRSPAKPPTAPGKPTGKGEPASPVGSSTAFALTDQGKGPRKLVVVLDGRQATRSEILYCVECPGHDEW